MSLDPLGELQADVEGRLLAESYFADIKLLARRKGIIADDVTAALATLNEAGGKIGAVVIVLMPTFRVPLPDIPGPHGALNLTVRVVTNPEIADSDQGAGKSAEEIAAKVVQTLHGCAARWGSTISCDDNAGIVPTPVGDLNDGDVGYDVTLAVNGGITFPGRVCQPVITRTGTAAPATATISCATSGAAIYWSIDGSFPSSAGAAAVPPTATTYTAPFSITSACTLLVTAQLAGKIQSDVASAVFT